MRYCSLCAGRLEARIDGSIQGLYCSAWGEWDVVATYLPPIRRDYSYYTVSVMAGDPHDTAHVRAIASLAGEGYLQAEARLSSRPVLRFRAQPFHILLGLAVLDAAALAYTIEPAFPYTSADADGWAGYAWDSRHIIDGSEIEASPPSEGSPYDLLDTPESYPGLPSKLAASRAFRLTRRAAHGISATYVLLGEGTLRTLRRVEIGQSGSPTIGLTSFGADASISRGDERRFYIKAKNLKRLEPTATIPTIDGLERLLCGQ